MGLGVHLHDTNDQAGWLFAPGASTLFLTRSPKRRVAAQVRVLLVADDPQVLRPMLDALVKSAYTPIVTAHPGRGACHLPVGLRPRADRGHSAGHGNHRLPGQRFLAGGAARQDQGGLRRQKIPGPSALYISGDLTIAAPSAW